MEAKRGKMKAICKTCHTNSIPTARAQLGYTTCLPCGEKVASKVRHCAIPLNKSNYMYVSDMDILKQTNPKRTT